MARFTYEDYLRFPSDGKRYEIIEGERFEVPTPSLDHQRVIGQVYLIVAPHLEERHLGEAIFAPFDVVLDRTNVVQPDIVFIAKANLKRVDGDLKGAPDLAVEVLSPSTEKHDRTRKLSTYESHGVRHVWFLDPATRALEELELVRGKYKVRATLAGDATFEPRVFPGLEIPLAKVWPKKR